MEVDGFPNNSAFGVLSDNGMDLDLMDELLDDECWIEATAGNIYNFPPSGSLISGHPSETPHHSSSYATSGNYNMKLPPECYQGELPKCVVENSLPVFSKIEELVENQSQELKAVETAASPNQLESFLQEGSEVRRRLWIAPKTYPCPPSVHERLELAVSQLGTLLKDRHVLIQMWMPTKKEGRQVLTTVNQPFSLDHNCNSLVSYRGVSSSYLFGIDKDSKLSIGLPGRVFLEKLPEWTPDVRFFGKDEYPRIDYANQYEVRGSIALPIFERGNSSCLGVVEFVTTTQKTHYRPELDTVCKALEAFDLRTSHSVHAPSVKVSYELYQATVPVIEKVLTSLCMAHKLPLAQTWGPCVQLGKDGCRHSNDNYRFCVSTVDSACYMANEEMNQFHEACSEHHLFQGQGLVGRAFLTYKPIFASDVAVFRKTVYPLSHHARMFRLHAVAAIPLGRIHSGSPDFVLEFFLPEDCKDIDRQKEILNTLSIVIQQACQMLHLTMGQGFGREEMLPAWEMLFTPDATVDTEESRKSKLSSRDLYSEKPSWIAHMIEAQKKSEGVAFSVKSPKQPKKQFSLTAHWDNNFHSKQVYSECGQLPQVTGTNDSVGCNQDSSFIDERHSPQSRQSGEKRRTKTEKTINIQVLRQYFAGSLKDAAKSIGVCPTTLKRICRQHGINRWPSRKIKKVGHSLRKLQLVIDSVQGADGAIQIGTFYKSFPELSSPNILGTDPFSSSKVSDCSQKTNPSEDNALCSQPETGSKSPPSSGSQSTSSTGCSSEEKQVTTTNISTTGSNEHGKSLKRSLSDADLDVPNSELFARSQSHKFITDPSNIENGAPQPKTKVQNLIRGSGFTVKATFGDDIVRFGLQPNWGFRDLQQEIARRLRISDINEIHVKYLDDEKEWVLLTCDDDLEECVDIYRLAHSRTIKLSLN